MLYDQKIKPAQHEHTCTCQVPSTFCLILKAILWVLQWHRIAFLPHIPNNPAVVLRKYELKGFWLLLNFTSYIGRWTQGQKKKNENAIFNVRIFPLSPVIDSISCFSRHRSYAVSHRRHRDELQPPPKWDNPSLQELFASSHPSDTTCCVSLKWPADQVGQWKMSPQWPAWLQRELREPRTHLYTHPCLSDTTQHFSQTYLPVFTDQN